jgi:RNA polymerase sigma-70 factor (ECF subfamily)
LFSKRKNNTVYSESDLIELSKSNHQYFGALYEKYFETIFRFIFKRLGGNELVSGDLTQQTFMKAMVNINKYEDRGFPLSSWLFRIAQNEVNLYFRSQKNTKTVDVNENQLKSVLEEMDVSSSMTIENQEKLIQCINNLEPEQADLIELRFFQEMSYKEIGDIYAISEANAKMRIYRLIEKIQKNWK